MSAFLFFSADKRSRRLDFGCLRELRLEVCDLVSEKFDYNSVVLLVPGIEPIILSVLNLACSQIQGFCSSFISFEKEAVLSLKSPFGEVIGIALKHHSEGVLNPDSSVLSYTMRFEKVSLPGVILQRLLETGPLKCQD